MNPTRDSHARGPGRPAARQAGFTLIELLASMTVLTLLVLMVAQMVNNTVLTTVATGKRIDADSQARLIFDRMGSDFAGIVKRPDANYYFHHQSGNDALYFFSDSTGYFAGGDPAGSASGVRNTLTLTGYRVSDQISNNTRFQLERLGRGLHWYDASPGGSGNGPLTAMVFLPQTIATAYSNVLTDANNNSSNLSNADAATSTNAPQWDVIGDQVLRLEFCYLLKDGTLAAVPAMGSAAATNNLGATRPPGVNDDGSGAGGGYTSGSRWYDTQAEIGYVCASAAAGAAVWNPIGLQDIRAVVVAVVILDDRSRLLASAAAMKQLAAKLPDFSAAAVSASTGKPTLMSDAWKAVITGPAFASTTGLPQSAASSVRVYQRYFFLN